MKLIPLIGFKGIFGDRGRVRRERERGGVRTSACDSISVGIWYLFAQSQQGTCDLSRQEVNPLNSLTEQGARWKRICWQQIKSVSLFFPPVSSCCSQSLSWQGICSVSLFADNLQLNAHLWASEAWWQHKVLWDDPWLNEEHRMTKKAFQVVSKLRWKANRWK